MEKMWIRNNASTYRVREQVRCEAGTSGRDDRAGRLCSTQPAYPPLQTPEYGSSERLQQDRKRRDGTGRDGTRRDGTGTRQDKTIQNKTKKIY
jgi:hypothetical protein